MHAQTNIHTYIPPDGEPVFILSPTRLVLCGVLQNGDLWEGAGGGGWSFGRGGEQTHKQT